MAKENHNSIPISQLLSMSIQENSLKKRLNTCCVDQTSLEIHSVSPLHPENATLLIPPKDKWPLICRDSSQAPAPSSNTLCTSLQQQQQDADSPLTHSNNKQQPGCICMRLQCNATCTPAAAFMNHDDRHTHSPLARQSSCGGWWCSGWWWCCPWSP